MHEGTNRVLHQQAKTGEQRHFELRAGRELHVTGSHHYKTTKYAFSILAMLEQGKRCYLYKKRWLVLGLFCVLLIMFLPVAQRVITVDWERYFLPALLVLSFAALLFFMLLVNSFSRSHVFFSTHTRLPLVEFWVNKPTRREFQEFVTALEAAVRQHKAEMKVPYNKQLAGELRTLRRVTEAGCLSESVYQAAKAKLLLMSDQAN